MRRTYDSTMSTVPRGPGRGAPGRPGGHEALAWAEPSPGMTPPGSEVLADARESTVSFVVVRGLVEAVEQAGVDRSEFLRAAGLDQARLAAPEARMARDELHALCTLAIRLTGDAALGLHWAERLSERTFVPISHLIAHSSSLGQGFELLAQFFQLLSDQPAYQVFESGDAVTFRAVPFAGDSPEVHRFSSEMMVFGFWKLARSFGARVRSERVSFDYAAPAHLAEYDRLFEGRVRFDEPFTGIVFDRAMLSAPSPQKDDDVRTALQLLAEQRLQRLTDRTPFATRVRDLLVRQGSRRGTDMASIAHELGMSVRSLRRRLTEEGKPYDTIVNEALGIVAMHLLRDRRRTIQEVAYEMGFSDASTFHRAFKRWTGTTPSVYRDAQVRDDDRG